MYHSRVWRDVVGFPGYRVSSDGVVWSDKNNCEKRSFPDKKGYMRVQLYGPASRYTYKVHRLVALHFIPNPRNLPQVNHKDGVKNNNRVSNLEWSTNRANSDHAKRSGLFFRKRELDPLIARIAGALIDGYRIRALAQKLDTTSTTINRHMKDFRGIPDFEYGDMVTGVAMTKGYYFDGSRNKWRVDFRDFKNKQFATEQEVKNYVTAERRKGDIYGRNPGWRPRRGNHEQTALWR